MFKLVVLSIVVACVYAGVAPKPQVKHDEAKVEAPWVKSTPLYGHQHDQKSSEEVKSEEEKDKAPQQVEPLKDNQSKTGQNDNKNEKVPVGKTEH